MKLYWRMKINGKWTWRPAAIATEQGDLVTVIRNQTTFENQEEE